MLENLKLLNLPSNHSWVQELCGQPHHANQPHPPFILKTCQRTLLLELNCFSFLPFHNEKKGNLFLEGDKAYQFALEVLCGLHSQILAENEIVSQFREAFTSYLKQKNRNSQLLKILEKLLKDAKEIRSKYLLGIGQKTYAGMARKLILSRLNDSISRGPEQILILGSGKLATDLLNQLKKKYTIFLSARNADKVKELCEDHGSFALPWEEISEYRKFPFILNTVGANNLTLFDHSFFLSWLEQTGEQRLFLDFGSPSTIQTSLSPSEGVIRLEDILQKGEILNQEKCQKIEDAKVAITELTYRRRLSFQMAFPYGWEELQFA